MNGRCLDCGELVPNLSVEELEAAGWHFFGEIRASGFPRRNWWCDDCVKASIETVLKRAAKEVAPIVAREREGERITAEVMNFRMR